MVSLSQGLPWIETVNYKINIPVSIFVAKKDSLIPYQLVELEAKKWLSDYTITYDEYGNHAQWNNSIIINNSWINLQNL